jgi:hypothetical protein
MQPNQKLLQLSLFFLVLANQKVTLNQ